MNLPLHSGWPGALEAGLLALLIGALVYAAVHWLARDGAWRPGHDVGWAMLVAVAIGAGIDLWHLFYITVVKLESPVYARIALQKIHDADFLGRRVVLELVGALVGVGLAWTGFTFRRERRLRGSGNSGN